MYKYIISWIIVSIVSAPCPDANKTNEFGVTLNSYMSCLVYHTKTLQQPMQKQFDTKNQALQFKDNITMYAKLQPINFLSPESQIIEIKLDSIKQ